MAFNPELGSTSPAVLLDNAERLDKLVNGPAADVPDRGGDPLYSWRQMMAKNDEIRQNLIPLSKQYMTLADAQADIANIPVGSTTYYRSPDDAALAVEVVNSAGTLIATGRKMPSLKYVDDKVGEVSSLVFAIPEKVSEYAACVEFDDGRAAPFMNSDGRLIFIDSDGNVQLSAADGDLLEREYTEMSSFILPDGTVCTKIVVDPNHKITEAWTEDGGYYFVTPDGLTRAESGYIRPYIEMPAYVLPDGAVCQRVIVDPDDNIVEAWTTDGGYYFAAEAGLVRVGGNEVAAQKIIYATGVSSSMFLNYGPTRISAENDSVPVMYVLPTWGQSLAQAWTTATTDTLIATTNLYPENMFMFASSRGAGKENPNRGAIPIDSIVPLVESINGGWHETACSSSAAHIIKAVEDMTGRRINILRYVAAEGGKAYRDLTRGTTSWDALVQGLIDAKRVCEQMGYRPVVLGLDVKAGETDTDGTAGMYHELYTRMLMNLDRNFNAEVKRVFGGDHPEVPIYVEQCSWQPNGAWDSRVRQGQLDADGIGNIRFTGASYQYPHTGDVIHINSKGQNSRGVQLARAVVFENFGTGFMALKPARAWWSGSTTIDIECLTSASITKDTTNAVVNSVGLGAGGGFRVRKLADNSELTITASAVISAASPAVIRLTVENPDAARAVQIGYATYETGTTHQAGPVDGARGLFRTNAGMTNLYTGESEYQWLPAFLMEIN